MKGKSVLITGGNSGIGFATAQLFKEKGYVVTISGRDPQRVSQAAKKLQVSSLLADMGNPKDIKQLASHFIENGLDVLVNNAAIAKFIPLSMCSLEDYNLFYEVNLRGPLLLIQELLPALEQKQGTVVNISSAVVNNGLSNAALYAAGKGAMDAYTKSLAVELSPLGIRVNVVSPGATDTPIMQKLGLPENVIQEVKQQQEATTPLRRWGKPEEIAQVILAQAEATYVTGSVWHVDGGVDAT